MKYTRKYAIGFTVAVAACSLSLGPAACAKNKAVEYMKYFNPLPQKNYLNESQDRLIKKGNFKTAQLPSTPQVKNPELGFFAIVPAEKSRDLDFAEKLLADEKTNGISLLLPWSSLEPEEEKYDWSSIDGLLSLCEKHKKSLLLRVSTAGALQASGDKAVSDTPAWVFANGAKSVKFLDKDKKARLMPVFWDQTYLAAFSNFINEMGSRYDKNLLIHSIGITGGGYRGGTSIVPTDLDNKGADKTATNETGFSSSDQIEDYLRKQQGMTQKQIIDHWKYVADLFPQAFPNTRLNFAINPPTHNRAGEDALDEISDYLLYRYGEHIYITRQDLKNGKHGFDDYRVLLKFRPDTYAGLSLLPTLDADDMQRISKTALDDGISFIEIPAEILSNSDPIIQQSISKLASHMGYQIISQKAVIPAEIFQGDQLKAEFSFLNVGDSSPKRPVRELDKDVPSSYKVMIELKDDNGKVVAKILHTPEKKTESWKTGEIVNWQQSLRLPQLPLGEYSASLSLVDPASDKKLNLLDGRNAEKPQVQCELALGKLKVLAPATANKTVPN
ncbi:MAG: beta-galactosidase [Candidatus Obscuribacterales bacterium]|nr:beta-galactosidase [Candidatus Obscuribacterales bacterium]